MTLAELLKLKNLLSRAEVTQSGSLVAIACGLAMLETAGIASLLPLLSVVNSEDALTNEGYLKTVYQWVNGIGIQGQVQFIILLSLVSALMLVIASVYKIFAIHRINAYVEQVRQQLSTKILNSYLNKSYSFFIESQSSILLKNVVSEVDLLTAGVVRPLVNMFSSIIIFTALTILLFIASPLMASFTAALAIMLYLTVLNLVKKIVISEGEKKEKSNSARFQIASQAFAGIKYIKFLGFEARYIKQFQSAASQFSESQKKYATLTEAPKYIIETAAFVIGLCSLSLKIYLSRDNWNAELVSLGPTLVLFILTIYRLQPALQNIYAGINSMRYAAKSIEIISQAFNSSSAELSRNWITHQCSKTDSSFYSLENIFYTYPSSQNINLSNVNLKIKRGTTTAIVGRSGAGKTTLIDIILGLLKPDKGKVVINTNNVSSHFVDINSLIGYVPQDVFIFEGTIEKNVIMDRNITTDSSQIERCLDAVGMLNFAKLSKNKNERLLGERGVKMSGGQRQRLGIARALFKNPEVLILDEATSALDAISERQLLAHLKKFDDQITIISISHRKSCVLGCDNIIYMSDGKIVDTGTFEELAESYSKFSELFS